MRVAILTLSDTASRGERHDASGEAIKAILLKEGGFQVVAHEICPDDEARIVEILFKFSDSMRLDLVLTTGGTGLSPRDVTPEATRKVVEKEIPGIPELMRLEGIKITRRAALSRAVAGIRGRTLIVNLPGSEKAARESLSAILPVLSHALKKVQGDTSPCGEKDP